VHQALQDAWPADPRPRRVPRAEGRGTTLTLTLTLTLALTLTLTLALALTLTLTLTLTLMTLTQTLTLTLTLTLTRDEKAVLTRAARAGAFDAKGLKLVTARARLAPEPVIKVARTFASEVEVRCAWLGLG
jgi:hypothetical protein